MDKYELDDYIKLHLSQGQLVGVLTDHLVEHTEALTFIVTKHNAQNMNISRMKK